MGGTEGTEPPVGAPDPMHDHGVDEGRENAGEQAVGVHMDPLGHRPRHDRSSGGSEGELEEPVGIDRGRGCPGADEAELAKADESIGLSGDAAMRPGGMAFVQNRGGRGAGGASVRHTIEHRCHINQGPQSGGGTWTGVCSHKVGGWRWDWELGHNCSAQRPATSYGLMWPGYRGGIKAEGVCRWVLAGVRTCSPFEEGILHLRMGGGLSSHWGGVGGSK